MSINDVITITKSDLKGFFREKGYQIYLSVDFGLLLIGLWMIFISVYEPICGATTNELRLSIGAVCLAIWFLLFPLIDREYKDKALMTLGCHMIITIIIALIAGLEINYFLKHLEGGPIRSDILFAVGGIVVSAYCVYCFIGILKAFYYIVTKVRGFIFPKLKEEITGIKNVVEGFTAFMLSLTAFGGSIIGFLTIIRQILDGVGK